MQSGPQGFRRTRNPGQPSRYTWGEEIPSTRAPELLKKRTSRLESTRYSRTPSSSRGGHVDRERSQAPASTKPAAKIPTPITSGSFKSPPLLPGLLESLTDVLGPDAKPTPIQAMSISHLLDSPNMGEGHKQCLLASETGSGKSIAYLLPLLQSLKQSEPSASAERERDINPRALVLAPTHELSRQLSGFAKSLLHNVKLRVLCSSRANAATRNNQDAAWSTEKLQRQEHDVDVLVGTPMKVMEMIRGRGWDRVGTPEEGQEEEHKKWRKGRDLHLGEGIQQRARAEPEVSLSRVEWVIVDEADVLFDPDFQESTRLLLSDIAKAKTGETDVLPQNYPFNLVLTTATIPSALQEYLSTHHPTLTRLTSPNIHRLPSTLKTQYVSWTGGNKFADIERQIRQIWRDEHYKKGMDDKSKVLVFCNKSEKVEELAKHLTESGIDNVALTRTNDTRRYGSNHHLDGFLKSQPARSSQSGSTDPKVLITTSLLSRGLDFSPSIRHVLIVDEPRNMVDFLHRAGRSGRAGQEGNVVVFGKMEGRGSDRAREVRKKVAEVSGSKIRMRA